jgi:hypothetical protein
MSSESAQGKNDTKGNHNTTKTPPIAACQHGADKQTPHSTRARSRAENVTMPEGEKGYVMDPCLRHGSSRLRARP